MHFESTVDDIVTIWSIWLLFYYYKSEQQKLVFDNIHSKVTKIDKAMLAISDLGSVLHTHAFTFYYLNCANEVDLLDGSQYNMLSNNCRGVFPNVVGFRRAPW